MNDYRGQAFPSHPHATAQQVDALGMTLRDYFAAQALPRLLGLALQLEANGKLENGAPEICARLAYIVADAMLKERNQ